MEETLQLLKKVNNDSEWFIKNYDPIEAAHREKYVAIENGEIVDSNKIFENLLDDLKKRGKNPAELLIKFVHKKDAVLIFHI